MVDRNIRRGTDARTTQSVRNVTPEWLSVRQMQDLLGIGHTKAYSLISSGELPGVVKIGRIIRINRQELTTWLAQQKYQSGND